MPHQHNSHFPTHQGFLLTAARYEMNRAELHNNLTPRRFLHAATAYAMLLYQSFRCGVHTWDSG